MKIVCLADTHGLHNRIKVPDGDILIHAGDITSRGEIETIVDFNQWLGTLPHKEKIVIAGNHDFCFENNPTAKDLLFNAIYLQDQSYTLDGLKIYGSPWQPRFFDWAFNVDRGEPIRKIWNNIPYDTDILVTHGPPRGIGDIAGFKVDIGCEDLLEKITVDLKLKLHVFGHIHDSYGTYNYQGITFVNASICNESYEPINLPIVIDI